MNLKEARNMIDEVFIIIACHLNEVEVEGVFFTKEDAEKALKRFELVSHDCVRPDLMNRVILTCPVERRLQDITMPAKI